jgi:uncharacterized protein YbbK (DUF523 family)
MKERILISACLLGVDCKYDGGNNRLPEDTIEKLTEKYELIPVCPECYGGLTTPRTPSERLGDKVVSKTGADVTEPFRKGAEAALYLAGLFGVRTAILKANSPSCGSGTVYDGTFTGALVHGDGVTAELLKAHGIKIIDENAL